MKSKPQCNRPRRVSRMRTTRNVLYESKSLRGGCVRGLWDIWGVILYWLLASLKRV